MIERVKHGQPWRPRKVSDENTIAECAEEFQQAGYGSLRRQNTLPSQALVSLRNDAAQNIVTGRVLEVGDLLLDEPDADNVFHEGLLPTPDTDKVIAISTEPLLSGEIGDRAFVISGHVYCRLNVTDAGHVYADAGAGTTLLQSGATGRAKIVWKEAGTGEKNALVLLQTAGADAPTSATYFGKLASDLSSGSTGTLTIWCDGSSTSDSITVRNRTGQTLKSGILLQATQGIGCTEYLAGPYELEACE